MEEQVENKAEFLLSSDTISWYWLDMIFQIAKEINFDGIDLALWKSFDCWNVSYVKTLTEKYNIPVKVVQVSGRVNSREMNKAVDMAKELDVDTISINPPAITDYKTYKFITDSLGAYRRQNPKIKFCIINPPKSSFFILPIPKYYFTNVVEIIKKYKSYLGLDIANLDETSLEVNFLRKISNFVPYIWVVYLSDKTKTWVWHVGLWDWALNLTKILKKFKQHEYFSYFSLKLDIEKNDLADVDKIKQILKKSRLFYKENFEDLVIK